MRRLFFVLAIFGLMLAMGSSARADSISFDLSTIANDGTGGPLHGGTVPAAYLVLVTVTTDVLGGTNCPNGVAGTHCVEVVLAPDTANHSTLTYVPDPVYINVSGVLNSTFLAKGNDGIPSGPGTFDTFGTMSVGSGSGKVAEVDFYLTPINGNSWASAANVLIPTTNYNHTYYSQGFMAVDGGFKNTTDHPGYPDNGTATDAEDAGYYVPTPEPMSLLLLGGCLLGVGRKLAALLG